MSAPGAKVTNSTVAGQWIIYSHSINGPLDITYVRGVATIIGGWTLSDPFGAKQFTLTFPGITVFEQIGQNDLSMIHREADVDIEFVGALPTNYPDGRFVVEGYMESFSWSPQGLTVECKGALYQLDNYQAKPEYPARPIPYELALLRPWDDHPDMRVNRPTIIWPAWWTTKYVPVTPKPAPYLIPTGVASGKYWSNLVTRSTGRWEPALTSYITGLLSSWYTPRGRFVLDLLPGRKSVIRHRDFAQTLSTGHLVIDAANPGLEVSVTQDFSQSLNVVYGQGKSLSGLGFSGRSEGAAEPGDVDYIPLASIRQVDPVENENRWLDVSVMRREVLMELAQGLDLEQAQDVATSHLNHFADPGYTGSLTLKSDPNFLNANGSRPFLPRMTIREGISIQVSNLFGRPEGVLFHITELTVDPAGQSVALTVDSKYRDALTVDEVRLRGRDSLAIVRSIIAGSYTPPIPDQLMPWNYAEGSGFIPSGGGFSSVPLFSNFHKEVRFPWTELTTLRPPSSKAWRHCYIGIGPKNANATYNWAQTTRRADNKNNGKLAGYPIKMSAAGDIGLLQVVAVDANGNPLKVAFHISFYYSSGVSVSAMPTLRSIDTARGGYGTGQAYPFFDSAWETYNMDGTQITSEQTIAVPSASMLRGYGTGKVPAGFWPGDKPFGDPVSGQLVDEGNFAFNLIENTKEISTQEKGHNQSDAGYIYCMIYCDGQAAGSVFFVGRMFRNEPGTTN